MIMDPSGSHSGHAISLVPQSARKIEAQSLHAKAPFPGRKPLISREGGYMLERMIGQGTFGSVFQARDQMGHLVAIKRLKAMWKDERSIRAQFRVEDQAMGRASHPGLVRRIGSSLERDRPFIVMEYIDAVPLWRATAISWGMRHVLAALSDLCGCLGAMHSQGVFHRDIHPGHMLIDRSDSSARLVDLGLARVDGLWNISDTYCSPIGSPPFFSPELTYPGEQGDVRSDIYSLAASAYAILSGKRPFKARMLSEYIRMAREDEPAPIREAAPDLPQDIAFVIHRAMSKDPSLRPGSAMELQAEFEKAMRQV